MRLILVLASLVIWTYSSASVSNCFFIQRFRIDSPIHLTASNLTWRSTQDNIVNSSYVLSGWSTPASISSSYNAWLSNITPAGGQFNLNISSSSNFLYIQFTVILSKSCNGNIQLQLVDYYPRVFNMAGRQVHVQATYVNVAPPGGSDVSRYMHVAILSGFWLNPISLQELQVTVSKLALGQSTQTVLMYSDSFHRNIYTRVGYTYILIDIWSFNSSLIYLNSSLQVRAFPASSINLNIDSSFNPYLSQKCIIGIQWQWTRTLNLVTSIFVTDSGNDTFTKFNIVNGLNMNGLRLSTLCFQECQGSYVDYQGSSFACNLCSNKLANCQSCTSATSCTACANNYFLFISINQTSQCVLVCPDGYYGEPMNSMCISCISQCLTCTNFTACLTCKTGWTVQGGCTSVIGCSQVQFNATSNIRQCIACIAVRIFQSTNRTCICQAGYRQVGSTCTNILGCIATIRQGDNIVCKYCNINLGLSLINGTCNCSTGFSLENSQCTQICGDGKVFTLPCDDSNNADGDGCSSICQLETNYKCLNGSSISKSSCIYLSNHISFSLARIDRTYLKDQGIFTLQLHPPLYNINASSLISALTFQCRQTVALSSITISKGTVTIFVDYFQDLEGNQANVTLTLDPTYFAQESVSLNFSMISNGIALILTSNQSKILLSKKITQILSIVIFLIFCLSVTAHRMIGIEFIHYLQIIYFLHLIKQNQTIVSSLLRYFAITTFNFAYFMNDEADMSSMQSSLYSKDHEFTLEIIVGGSYGLLILFLLSRIGGAVNFQDKQIKSIKQDQQPSKLEKLSKIIYNYLIFSFVMGTFIISTLYVENKKSLFTSSALVNCMCLLQMTLLSFVFFGEWTHSLAKSTSIYYLSVPRCKGIYLSIYLIFLRLATLILSIGYRFPAFPAEIFLAAIYFLYLCAMIIYRPYKNIVHNIGVIVNCLAACFFLFGISLKMHGIIQLTEENELDALGMLLAIIGISTLTTVLRIMYQLWRTKLKHCLKSEKKEEITFNGKSSQNDKKSIPQNCSHILAREYEYMSRIQQQNLKRVNILPNSLFYPQHSRQQADSGKQILKRKQRLRFRQKYGVKTKGVNDKGVNDKGVNDALL